jgi:hypothetical protein
MKNKRKGSETNKVEFASVSSLFLIKYVSTISSGLNSKSDESNVLLNSGAFSPICLII